MLLNRLHPASNCMITPNTEWYNVTLPSFKPKQETLGNLQAAQSLSGSFPWCDKNSKENTCFSKHCLSQPHVLKNSEETLQHLLLINFDIPQNSRQQNYPPFYNYFFRNQNYSTSSKEQKQTYWRSLNSFTQLPSTSSMFPVRNTSYK